MKKLLSGALALSMSVSMLTACSTNNGTNGGNTGTNEPETENGLVTARNYLYSMYKESDTITPADFTRVGVIRINGTEYEVKWTADSDTINFNYGDDKMVTVDVDELNPEEVNYTLTATLTDEAGNTETVSFSHSVPAAIIIEEGMSYEEIVDAAYALADGVAMEDTLRLYGTITEINTPWSEEYQNISVTIQIGELADKPIECFRLKGDGAADLAVGDDITVEGILKNYKGTIEYDAGCILVGMGEHVDQSALLEAAYALADGLEMNEPCTLKGVISSIDTAWSEEYQNITVTIVCDGQEDKPIQCFRLKGDGAAELEVGDIITVTGTIKNYKGTVEFDAGCALDSVVKE